jgi:flagellar motility protein MotE (MotC chaperone)
MIKNLAIGGVVGLLFMVGGFFGGMRFVHVPVPKKIAAVATTAKAPAVISRDAISIDALRKTSQNMMDVNQALQARELAVAAREKKAREREDELDAERAALDRSHAKFKELYTQFEQRLQLVTANESDQMQRQMTIYTTMDPAEAADLLRALDDGTIVRFFSIMDTKPLANLVSAWKAKYPADSTRLLTALTQMGTVMPQDKIALSDPAAPAPVSDANATPAPAPASDAAPASTDTSANTPPPDTGAPSNASADNSTAPAAAPSADSTASTPMDASSAPAAPASDTSSASTSSSTSNPSAPDASSSSGSASASTPESATPSPAAPASPTSPSLAPPSETPAGQGTGANPATTSELGVPGATAAEAAVIAQRRTGRLSADISNDRAY